MNGEALFNTKHAPARFTVIKYEAMKAKAYYHLHPYPQFGYADWKEEERGPLPKCRPFIKHITNKSAYWLFGKPVSFKCDQSNLVELVNEVWDQNKMGLKMLMGATNAGQSGGVVLKFSYDKAASPQVKIDVLDAVEQCRLYFDPHDCEKLIMARVQYPYWDAERGEWWWHREEWTENFEVQYEPMQHPGKDAEKPEFDPYGAVAEIDKAEWEVKTQKANKFKVIPVTLIKNIEAGGTYGRGDLWGYWPLIDQLNFNSDLSHKDNQRKVWPKEVYIDAKPPASDAPGQSTAGGVEEVESKSDQHQAKVELLEAKSPIREYMQADYDALLRELYDAVGAVILRAEDITNKGNLTQSVLTQMYAPLIETTDAKRESYGENGVCKFLENMSTGLRNFGVQGWGSDVDFKPVWPSYFELTEEDLKAMTDRLGSMLASGFTTQERAAKTLAVAEGVEDIEELLKELPEPVSASTENNEQTRNNQVQPRSE